MLDFLKNLFTRENWKTSLAGILTLVGLTFKCVIGGGALFGCISEAWPVAFAGIGLIFASDSRKSK